MFKISNLFVALMLFVLACVTAKAQETTTVTPAKPAKATTSGVFSFGGGSYIGVHTLEVTKENFSKFGLRDVRGVAVEKVTENSPAAQAGLQANDVIVKFNGEEVSSMRKLQRLISEVSPDHQAKITVLRGGSERDFTVTVGNRPTPSFQTGNFTMAVPNGNFTMAMPTVRAMPNVTIPRIVTPAMGTLKAMPNMDNMVWSYAFGRTIGVGTTSLNKQLGDYFGVADGKGILINSVRENSPAAKAGLKAGDVIVEADGKAVGNSGELMKALNSKEKGSVTLTILRNKNRQTITVEPEENKNPGFQKFEWKSDDKKPSGVVTTLEPTIAPFTLTTVDGGVFTIDMDDIEMDDIEMITK